jgi:hypothetical protein
MHAERTPSIVITLTGGNIRNDHVYLRDHLDFFPKDAVGAPAAKDGLGRLLTVHFAGASEPVETDIAGGRTKLFFRARKPWGEFFRRHGLAEGDAVRITRLDEREYRVDRL